MAFYLHTAEPTQFPTFPSTHPFNRGDPQPTSGLLGLQLQALHNGSQAPLALCVCADLPLPLPHIIPHHSHVFGQASVLQPTCSLWKAHMGDTAWPTRHHATSYLIATATNGHLSWPTSGTYAATTWHPLQRVPAKKSDNSAPPLLIWSASPPRVHLTCPLLHAARPRLRQQHRFLRLPPSAP